MKTHSPNECHGFADSRVYYFTGYAMHLRAEKFAALVRASGRHVVVRSAPAPYSDDQTHDDFAQVVVFRPR